MERYAKLNGDQLDYYKGGSVKVDGRGTVYNPKPATLFAAGYYAVPETEAGRTVESWSLVDGTLVPTYAEDDPTPAEPRTFSKLRFVIALQSIGKWDALKAWLEANGYYDLFLAAQDFAEDNAQFAAAVSAAKDALGATDEEVEAVLAQCVAEE